MCFIFHPVVDKIAKNTPLSGPSHKFKNHELEEINIQTLLHRGTRKRRNFAQGSML